MFSALVAAWSGSDASCERRFAFPFPTLLANFVSQPHSNKLKTVPGGPWYPHPPQTVPPRPTGGPWPLEGQRAPYMPHVLDPIGFTSLITSGVEKRGRGWWGVSLTKHYYATPLSN